jgi:hypothetical protein
VAPGGTLLVVGHDLSVREHALAHGFDPDDYLQPRDVLAHLDEGWQVELDEIRPRVTPPGYHGPDVPDVVVRACRRT